MILVFFLLIPQLAASSPWRYSLYFENDTFFNTDYLYTNGVKISASSPSEATWEELGSLPEFVLPFVKSLPHSNRGKDSYSLTISMGQLIYTPEDTDRTEPVSGDRPYAGVGFLECGFNALGANRLTSVGVTLGVAGPHAFAEETQSTVHEMIGSDIPGGWDFQIKNTPLINITLEESWHYQLLGQRDRLSLEAIPMAGFGIGNALTFAHAGMQVRLGWNIPFDFGENLIRTGTSKVAYNDAQSAKRINLSQWSGYLFGGVDSQMVVYEVTLDNRRYDYPYDISGEPFRYNIGGGFGLSYGRYGFSFAQIYSSKTYQTQKSGQKYGMIRFSVAF